MTNIPRLSVHTRYVKKDGTIVEYMRTRENGRYLAAIRGPQLTGKAKRVNTSQADLYVADVARKLRDARLEAGVSVHELAAATQLNSATIFGYERGRKLVPKLATLVRVALALKLHPSEIMP